APRGQLRLSPVRLPFGCFFSSRRRHTRWPRDWIQTCALPISMIAPESETGLSIIGAGMRVVGDITAEGVVKIEGTVVGTVRAGRSEERRVGKEWRCRWAVAH